MDWRGGVLDVPPWMRYRSPNFQSGKRRGFTLLETALATVIVGTGVVAAMGLFGACIQQASAADRMTVATNLAENIHEAMIGLSFSDPGTATAVFGAESGETLATADDVDDFDGQIFSPPINSQRQTLSDLSQYSQAVSVWPVLANDLSTNSNESDPDLPQSSYQGAVRVRVRVMFRRTATDTPTEVYQTSWIRMDN
jgi:prepilin-type N-terminal cleavage/methylation domain-containing protein